MNSSERIRESLTIATNLFNGAGQRKEHSNMREVSQAILNLTNALSNLYYLDNQDEEESNELTPKTVSD